MIDNYLVFDFETVDPYIDRKLGAGWVYGINVPESDFEVLGVATLEPDIQPSVYDMMPIKCMANDTRYTLIAHNAQYDLGCAHFMSWPVKDVPIYDTEVMARLYDSSLMSYSLDNLASKYLNKHKDDSVLIDSIQYNDLYPWRKNEMLKRQKKGVVTYHKPSVRDWSKHSVPVTFLLGCCNPVSTMSHRVQG